MRKVKLIVHETYQGKRKSFIMPECVLGVNAAAFDRNTAAKTQRRPQTPNDLRIHLTAR